MTDPDYVLALIVFCILTTTTLCWLVVAIWSLRRNVGILFLDHKIQIEALIDHQNKLRKDFDCSTGGYRAPGRNKEGQHV